MKLMNFIQVHARITKSIFCFSIIPRQNHENYEIIRIPFKNKENHENLSISLQNHENHEILGILRQNCEKHENSKTRYFNNLFDNAFNGYSKV